MALVGSWVAERRREGVALVGLVLVGILTMGAVGYAAADMLVHPARDHSTALPSDVGLAFEPLRLHTEDGLALAAWWMPAAQKDAPIVVFLHAYGASKAQSLAVAPFLHDAGYNVLAFDFRAHGDSDGTHTTFGLDEARDVRAAVLAASERPGVDASRLALMGWSMGAAAAINAAPSLPEVRAIVADSPFASLAGTMPGALATLGLPSMPFGKVTFAFATWLSGAPLSNDSPVDAARQARSPLLLIQGGSDVLVRADTDARPLQEAAGERAHLWVVPGASHIDSLRTEKVAYERTVLAFLGEKLTLKPVAG